MKRALPDEEPLAAEQPKYHRDPSEWSKPPCPVTKAYRNEDFLNSSHARHIRILAEYEETLQRLRANGVNSTVMFFGSARSKDRPQYDNQMAKERAKLADAPAGSQAHATATAAIARLEASEWMVDYMEKIAELARRMTDWGLSGDYNPGGTLNGVARTSTLERRIKRSSSQERAMSDQATQPQPQQQSPPFAFTYLAHSSDGPEELRRENHERPRSNQSLFVCTGGGPGFMEAANRGASMVRGGRSIGMGITLPFEKGLNPYVTPELAFEFHYFFTRKFWMAYYMQALVVAPGGFGTCDELFEIVTLKQTGKMNKKLPVVLFGKQYWEEVVNWHALARYGTIAENDVSELLFTDSVDEAFEYLTRHLLAGESWQPELKHGD